MAETDLPTMVDYILKVTKKTKLAYVGHSQGTLIGFAKFSSDVKFAASKVRKKICYWSTMKYMILTIDSIDKPFLCLGSSGHCQTCQVPASVFHKFCLFYPSTYALHDKAESTLFVIFFDRPLSELTISRSTR